MLLYRILLLITLLHGATAFGQARAGFAYYDVDYLYDTAASPFYDDADYTPDGRLGWSGERYRRKVEQTAAVIAQMDQPLVGLYGVENQQVVRDLVNACALPYNYVHRTLNSLDGMDFALLYYGDRFFPGKIESGYGYLLVTGTLDDRPLVVLLTRGDRFVADILEEVREENPGIQIITAGKLDRFVVKQLTLADVLSQAERQGRGNACSQNGWWLHDRILTDKSTVLMKADVFARHERLDPHTGQPLPTYRRRTYIGGAGRYLPLFIYFK